MARLLAEIRLLSASYYNKKSMPSTHPEPFFQVRTEKLLKDGIAALDPSHYI
jgi:hypothetical protein